MVYSDTAVVFPYRPDSAGYRVRSLEFVHKAYESYLPGATIVVADDPGERFNRGRALNAGVLSLPDHITQLVLADSDIWLPREAIREGVGWVRRNGGRYVIPFGKLIWLRETWTSRVLAFEQPVHLRPPQAEILLEWGQTSVGGCNIISRKMYHQLGGFDERFAGWGGEDIAWDLTMRTLYGPAHRLTRWEGRHLFHPEDPTKQNTEGMNAVTRLLGEYAEAAKTKAKLLEYLANHKPGYPKK